LKQEDIVKDEVSVEKKQEVSCDSTEVSNYAIFTWEGKDLTKEQTKIKSEKNSRHYGC
jgi:hypothetical protein